jgi:DNA-binding NtrC family response regulator
MVRDYEGPQRLAEIGDPRFWQAIETLGIIGRSPNLLNELWNAWRYGRGEARVLILGEPGVGKESCARLIHAASPRPNGPFIAVNCAQFIGSSLVESELFGAERGIATSVDRTRDGLVHAANGGTLFLDEVGDLPIDAQAKLLRLLEAGTYRRVGGTREFSPDFLLVCATNRDLDKAVKEGGMRRDFYSRIAQGILRLPTLRERSGDLLPLARHLSKKTLTAKAELWLRRQTWQGENIRGLRNRLQAAAALAGGDEIDTSHLEDAARWHAADTGPEPYQGFDLNKHLETIERQLVEKAFQSANGEYTKGGKLLNLSRPTFTEKVKRFGIGRK